MVLKVQNRYKEKACIILIYAYNVFTHCMQTICPLKRDVMLKGVTCHCRRLVSDHEIVGLHIGGSL